jgi:hypothetical protein
MTFLALSDEADALITLVIVFIAIFGGLVKMIIKAREQSGEKQQRPSQPSEPRPQSARDEVQRFLEEITGGAARSRTAAQQQGGRGEAPVAAPRARPVRKTGATRVTVPKAHRAARKRRAAAPKPSRAAAPVPKRAKARAPGKARPLSEVAEPLALEPTRTREKPGKADQGTLKGRLPEDPLQRAVLLREIFGPCRAKSPRHLLRW